MCSYFLNVSRYEIAFRNSTCCLYYFQMREYPFSIRWQFATKSKPTDLWPLISDTNRLFKKIGQLPIQHAPVSQDLPKGHREYTFEQIHRLDIWEEEPYEWEAPYHIKVKKTYRNGLFKNLLFSISISEHEEGSAVAFTFSGDARGYSSKFRVKRLYNSRLKRKFKKVLQEYDQILLTNDSHKNNGTFFLKRNYGKWAKLTEELTEFSGDPELSEKLVRTIKDSDFTVLKNLQPLEVAKYWDAPLHRVLDILFHASKIDILNYRWGIVCPDCKLVQQEIQQLSESTNPLYCNNCQKEFELDFHNSILLTFEPSPIVRKLPDKTFSFGNPARQPQVKMLQYVHPGQKKFIKIKLEPGNYKIYSDKLNGIVYASVSEEGMEHATLTFNKLYPNDQHVKLSTNPNLVLHNQTDERIFIKAEDLDWKRYCVSASEVTSLQQFRNLFPRELLRQNEKMKATSVTVLFTDIFNSSSLYNNEGDESAIGQVINHFEILRRIVREERGATVKTIGDAIMAVFQYPADAVRAFNRAQDYFKNNSSSESPIYLKGGMHVGDCTALTLNNTIDYFGNTVNIASRLVEKASSQELVISNEAYRCQKLRNFLKDKQDKITVSDFDTSLKGFEEIDFEVKRLSMSKSALRLVV